MQNNESAKCIYSKVKDKLPLTDRECQLLTYYESLKSREDTDHVSKTDPLVGALVTDKRGNVKALAHRANGLEGDHAEYSIINGELKGVDLKDMIFYTTLEPCVDDVRSSKGASCSSLLSSSAIETIHIGILDSNPNVYSKGLTQLFEANKTLIPFDKDIQEKIYISSILLRKCSNEESKQISRIKGEVFPKFQESSLETYLQDKYIHENGISSKSFNLSSEENDFALFLLRSGLISFNAKNVNVDQSIKIMFYNEAYLDTSNRQISISTPSPISEKQNETLKDSLPLVLHKLEKEFTKIQPLLLSFEEFKEAFVNAIIHNDYGPNSPLIYIIYTGSQLQIKNKASSNIPEYELEKLKSFTADSYPGNGKLINLFNLAGYCERNGKGQETFKASKPQPKYDIEGSIVKITFDLI